MKDSASPAGYEPNFVLPHREVVREDNWAEYEVGGFSVLWESIDPEDSLGLVSVARHEFGMANVFTGDAYDNDAGRPLRHKPGMGVYVSPDGVAYRAAQRANKPDAQFSSDPAVS